MCWIPIFKAKKLILAGDPMQLPPTILSLDKRKASEKGPGPIMKGSTKRTKTPGKAVGKSPGDSKKQEIPLETPQDQKSSFSDTDRDSDSDSVKGDTVIAQEDVSSLGEVEPKPKISGLPDKRPVLRPPRTLETTLFDRLEKMYGPGIKRLLNVQYRYVAVRFKWI